MEKMELVCLDSDVIIDFLNNDNRTIELLNQLHYDFSTTSINIFEIWSGRKKEEL